jgi:hypothetical protein
VPATCPFRGHARRFTVIHGAAGSTPGLCIRRSSCRGHFSRSKRSSEDDVPRGRAPSFGPGRAAVSAGRQALRFLRCLLFLPGSEDLPGGVIKGVTVPVHHLPSAVSRRKTVATQAHSAAGPRAGWTLGRIKTVIGPLVHVATRWRHLEGDAPARLAVSGSGPSGDGTRRGRDCDGKRGVAADKTTARDLGARQPNGLNGPGLRGRSFTRETAGVPGRLRPIQRRSELGMLAIRRSASRRARWRPVHRVVAARRAGRGGHERQRLGYERAGAGAGPLAPGVGVAALADPGTLLGAVAGEPAAEG